MWHDYQTFLDYLEMRRRVEKRLAKTSLLALHTFVFALIVGGMAAFGLFTSGWPAMQPYFIAPAAGWFITWWSGLLFLHSAATYWRSGLNANRRNRAIEDEMRRRLSADEGYFDADELFRLHNQLDEDLQTRASALPLYFGLAGVNLLVWLMFASQGAFTNFGWIATPILALMFAPFLARRNRMIAQREAELHGQTNVKRKREDAAVWRLAEDGEIIEDDDSPLTKPKRQTR